MRVKHGVHKKNVAHASIRKILATIQRVKNKATARLVMATWNGLCLHRHRDGRLDARRSREDTALPE